MTKKIKNLDVTRLRVEECFGFMKRIETLTDLLTQETDKQVVADFKAAVTAFDAALEASRKNSKTADVEAADARTDKAWRTLTQLTKTLCEHPTVEIKAAAAEVYAIMQKYGDITGMAYNEEYGNLHNALQELKAVSAAKQELILADALISELDAGYENYTVAAGERDAEQAQKQVGIVKQTRTECEAAYRTMVGKVNALVVVNGEDAYADFIDQANVIIDAQKATLAARSTRSGKGGTSSSSSSSSGSSTSGGSSSSSGSGSSSTDDGGADI